MKENFVACRAALTKIQAVILIAVVVVAAIVAAYYVTLPSEEGRIEITLVHPGVIAKVKAGWDPLIEEYEEANPNVKINLVVVGWSELALKLRTMVGAGNPPDIAFAAGVMTPTYAELGAIIAFDDYAWFTEYYSNSYESIWPDVTIDGKHYMIPSGCGPFTLMYNKKIAEEAGIPTWERGPQNWDEIQSYAEYIRDNTTHIPFAMTAGGGWDPHEIFFYTFLENSNGKLFDGLNGRALFNTSIGVQTLEWYVNLYKDGLTQTNPWTYTRGDIRPLFRDGKVGMYIEGPYAIPEIDAGMHFFECATQEECDAMFTTVPRATIGLKNAAYPPDADGLMVFRASEHIETAVDIVRVANSFKWQKWRSQQYGYTPVYKNSTMDEHFSHWLYENLYAVLESGSVGKVSSTHFDEIYRIMADYTVRAIKQEMTAKEALDQMAYLCNLIHGV